MELLDVGAEGLLGLKLVDLNDVDVVPGGLVDGGHLVVHLVDGTDAGGVPELLVQVVDAGPRSVTEEDAEVLDGAGLLLGQLVDGEELAVRLLDLGKLAQEVPEARLGHNVVLGEDAHAVHLGGGVSISGDAATDNLIFAMGLHIHHKASKLSCSSITAAHSMADMHNEGKGQ